ncbi:MAG TPA: PilX N-terminal domain-containing pilus assembly protein [Thermoanaerobaculia bacterium]|nr:PilX N-terminal domain-containing pilus assembly protein [Thermoanaerobaculia bacterium]
MSTHRSHRSGEAGSAYVLTLIVLLVLTLLGLVLALITQSEVEVGANERTINRAFYGAEAGITASVTSFLFNNSRAGNDLTFMDPGSTIFGTHVEVSPMVQLNVGPCNMCEVNQNTQYFNITHQIESEASRFGIDSDGNETILARKSLEMMVVIQPIQDTPDIENFDGEKP